MLQKAEGYKQEVVAKSKGEAERFISVYNSYKSSKDVTRQRIYLETLEQTLGNINKVIIDNDAQGGIVPYLPLPEIKKRSVNNEKNDGDN